MESQTPMTVNRVLSNPLLRIAMLRIATAQRTWILAGALAAAGVRVLRRYRERFALQGRAVLITGGARGLGPNPPSHERWYLTAGLPVAAPSQSRRLTW